MADQKNRRIYFLFGKTASEIVVTRREHLKKEAFVKTRVYQWYLPFKCSDILFVNK